ncbi:MAG TPA: hypothetical protein VJL59_05545 [Anaerolineales bacterium]|nr:hypothetical protein [Anaerolineales bacterium]
MAREYVISSAGITVAGATTLIFINPGTTMSLEILRMWVSQSANATSAQQRVQVETQVTAFPTLTSFTPRLLKQRDPASAIIGGTAGAAGTCGINASVEGAGAKSTLFEDSFNVLNGWLWVATPRETIIMPAGFSSGLGLFLPVAPATLTNWSFGLVYAELG